MSWSIYRQRRNQETNDHAAWEGQLSREGLRCMRETLSVAEKMGKRMGASEVLQPKMSSRPADDSSTRKLAT
jgi:hypothetical protein